MITLQERVHGVKPPEEWSLNKLHHVFSVRKNNKNIGMMNDNLLSLSYGKIVNKDIDTNGGLLPESFETYQIVNPGDIVMRLTDLQNDKRSIRQGLVKEKGIITSAYDAIYVEQNHDSRYWAYALLALDLAKYYYSLGGGVRQSIKFKDFPNDWLCIPSNQQQKRIADFLDQETSRIDNLIEKKKKMITTVQERSDSFLNEAMTGKFSSKDFMPSENYIIRRLPKDWSIRPLKTIVEIYGRIGFRGYTTNDMVDQGEGAITLSPSNIYEGEVTLSEKAYLSWEKYYESPEIQVRELDILFVKTGSTIGKTTIVRRISEAMTLNPQLVLMRNHKIEPLYLSYFLKSSLFQYQVSYNVFGGSTPAMSQSKLGRLFIAFPNDIHEQRSLAKLIDDEKKESRKLISSIRKSLLKLNEMRVSLITEAVTGQLDIQAWKGRGMSHQPLKEIEVDILQSKKAN